VFKATAANAPDCLGWPIIPADGGVGPAWLQAIRPSPTTSDASREGPFQYAVFKLFQRYGALAEIFLNEGSRGA
jgi:hypothetical protein